MRFPVSSGRQLRRNLRIEARPGPRTQPGVIPGLWLVRTHPSHRHWTPSGGKFYRGQLQYTITTVYIHCDLSAKWIQVNTNIKLKVFGSNRSPRKGNLHLSVRPSVRPSVCLCSHGWTYWPTTLILGARLCRVQQRALGVITSLKCLSVCLGVLRAHYTPLQRYMGYLCTRKAQYAPPRRNMHHGAQGRLYFLKNSGDPDDFLFWWFTENIHKICLSGKCLCGSDWHTRHTRPSRCCPLHILVNLKIIVTVWPIQILVNLSINHVTHSNTCRYKNSYHTDCMGVHCEL